MRATRLLWAALAVALCACVIGGFALWQFSHRKSAVQELAEYEAHMDARLDAEIIRWNAALGPDALTTRSERFESDSRVDPELQAWAIKRRCEGKRHNYSLGSPGFPAPKPLL